MNLSSNNLTYLLIEPTGYCNAKCPHCPRYTDDGFLHSYILKEHLQLVALKNGLDQTKLVNLKTVDFAGATGDPVMSPYIETLIEFFNFVPTIHMDTNGSLQTVKWWKNLARFSNLQVVWSIDGLEDTNHLYRVGTNYKKIMKNVQAYISAGGNAMWKCIIFKHNQHQIPEITSLAENMGFSGVQFVKAYDYRFQNKKVWPVVVEGDYTHDISPSELTELEITKYSKIFQKNSKQKNPLTQHSQMLTITCPWLKEGRAYINTSGHLLPCCMMTHEITNDYLGQKALQTIAGGSFDNISLYHNCMDDIFNNYYGTQFDQTLKNKDTMHPVCEKSCSEIIFERKNFITGSRDTTKHD